MMTIIFSKKFYNLSHKRLFLVKGSGVDLKKFYYDKKMKKI